MTESGANLELRVLEKDACLDLRNSTTYTLILVRQGVEQEGLFANSRGGKDEIVRMFKEGEGDLLMLAWVGQWKTDIFRLGEEELRRMYAGYEKIRNG